MSKTTIKPVAAAVGVALAGSLAVANVASASDNPFGAKPLSQGYLHVAEADKAQTETKSAGEKMGTETKKAAEGKCGAAGKAAAEGKCGGAMKAGEGKCGGEKKPAEGKCGGAK